MGSSEAAFCGVLQSRRGDASRWARLRRLPTGFSNGGAARSAAVPFCPSLPSRPAVLLSLPAARHRIPRAHAAAMLPVGLVQGGLLRGFPRSLRGSSEAGFPRGFFQCRRGGASRGARLRRLPTGFSNGGAARSAAVPFCPSFPRHRMPRVRSRPCEPAGSPFPFPHFPTARPYFFLYPAVLPAMPRATFPASICPAGRQGQRHFLCRLHGRRSSALPFRPIGGAPGTVPLFLHPAARGTDAARPFPPMRTGGQPLPFSTFSYRPAVLLSLPSRPASDAARHFSCILLSRWAAGTAPLSLPPARAAEQLAPFSPYRRRARHCTSFSAPRRPPPDAERPFPFMQTGGQSLPFSTFSPRARVMLLPLPCRPANDTAHGRRNNACRRARLRRPSAGFSNGGAARSAAVPFCPSFPRHRMPRVRSRPCEPAGSPFPFPHFPTARPYFFLYPAVLPAMPHATFPASFCPAGRQGQRRFLCRLHGRRSSALPFRPIGGAPGTAPLFLHPAARHRMPRTVAEAMLPDGLV